VSISVQADWGTRKAHPGTVVALTPMALLQLHKDHYERYLAPLADVQFHRRCLLFPGVGEGNDKVHNRSKHRGENR
jgi:hypothetical protein